MQQKMLNGNPHLLGYIGFTTEDTEDTEGAE